MALLSVLLHHQQILIFIQDIRENVHYVPEMNLIS